MYQEAVIYSYNPELASGTLKTDEGQILYFSQEDWVSKQGAPVVGERVQYQLDSSIPNEFKPWSIRLVGEAEPNVAGQDGDHADKTVEDAELMVAILFSRRQLGGRSSSSTSHHAGNTETSQPTPQNKTLWGWFIHCMQPRNLRLSGRASRREFWGFIAGYFAVFFTLSLILRSILQDDKQTFDALLLIAIIMEPFKAFVSVRRLHDLNLSGYWYLITYTPLQIFFAIPYLVLMAWPSQPKANRFGEPPTASKGSTKQD